MWGDLPTAQKLITVTEQSFYEGIKFARQGNRISDIGHAVQTYVESHGFGVVRAFVGHASAKRCTKNRKSQITVPPAEARAWSKA